MRSFTCFSQKLLPADVRKPFKVLNPCSTVFDKQMIRKIISTIASMLRNLVRCCWKILSHKIIANCIWRYFACTNFFSCWNLNTATRVMTLWARSGTEKCSASFWISETPQFTSSNPHWWWSTFIIAWQTLSSNDLNQDDIGSTIAGKTWSRICNIDNLPWWIVYIAMLSLWTLMHLRTFTYWFSDKLSC